MKIDSTLVKSRLTLSKLLIGILLIQCDCSADFDKLDNEKAQVTDEMIQRAEYSPTLQAKLRKIKLGKTLNLTEKEQLSDDLVQTVGYLYKDIVQVLLQQGADPSATNKDGKTALYQLAELAHGQNSKDEVLALGKLLLKNGASTAVKSSGGKTPLHIAALYGYSYMVEFLLDNRADTSARDNQGKTPLDLAQDRAVKNLLQLSNP
ncbi:MAG: ankyrin repeat domain-containing protein [Bacteroidota bacterium]